MDVNTIATIVLLGGFVVLMLLKVPVSFSLLIATVGAAFVRNQNPTILVQQMIAGINPPSLLAIPFFIFMGELMSEGHISEKIVGLANLVVGRFRGGLAYVNCLDSMFFGGISGSAVADVSSLGSVVVPMMVKQGYTPEFSVGLTVATACQGVLIPPSHNMVIYALAAGGVSIGSLLWAGMIPGILLGISLMTLCFFMANKYNFPKGTSVPKGQRIRVLVDAILPMFTLVIIMGGVAAGIFTATESSAVACLYTFLLTYIINRIPTFARLFRESGKAGSFGEGFAIWKRAFFAFGRSLFKVLRNSMKTLAIVLTLIAMAKAFAYMMTLLRIPAAITTALLSVTTNRILLILIINLLLLLLGCFMDMAPLIMIMTPILLPVVTSSAIGMSPIQFGIMLIFNLAIGLCTPPVGSALFVGCAVGKTSLERTSKAMLPMFLVMVGALLLVTFVPWFTMWLPSVFF
jgi:TRAP-type C4-dicarboxylate transport system permease large subunit